MPNTAKIHIHAFKVLKTENSAPLEALIDKVGQHSLAVCRTWHLDAPVDRINVFWSTRSDRVFA